VIWHIFPPNSSIRIFLFGCGIFAGAIALLLAAGLFLVLRAAGGIVALRENCLRGIKGKYQRILRKRVRRYTMDVYAKIGAVLVETAELLRLLVEKIKSARGELPITQGENILQTRYEEAVRKEMPEWESDVFRSADLPLFYESLARQPRDLAARVFTSGAFSDFDRLKKELNLVGADPDTQQKTLFGHLEKRLFDVCGQALADQPEKFSISYFFNYKQRRGYDPSPWLKDRMTFFAEHSRLPVQLPPDCHFTGMQAWALLPPVLFQKYQAVKDDVRRKMDCDCDDLVGCESRIALVKSAEIQPILPG
jgi:hypothetical protein